MLPASKRGGQGGFGLKVEMQPWAIRPATLTSTAPRHPPAPKASYDNVSGPKDL